MGCRSWAAASIVSAALLLAQDPTPAAADLDAGKQSYTTLCAQCHGADGDSLGYADIVPLAGIRRRYPPEVTAQLSGMFSGRILVSPDRERVVRYMGSLRGAKDFPDPGWLVTPYLLERKAPRIHQFRILDARDAAAYRAGHAANAVSVEPAGCLAAPEDTAQWLGTIGVTPSTMVIVYDEAGGPQAACVWWRIRRAGHRYVAVLDGGWNKSTAENRYTTTVVPKIQQTAYPTPDTLTDRAVLPTVALRLGSGGWNWERALDADGFRPYDELRHLAETAGLTPGAAFRVQGPEAHLAHFALTLHLLGYSVDYNVRTQALSLTSD